MSENWLGGSIRVEHKYFLPWRNVVSQAPTALLHNPQVVSLDVSLSFRQTCPRRMNMRMRNASPSGSSRPERTLFGDTLFGSAHIKNEANTTPSSRFLFFKNNKKIWYSTFSFAEKRWSMINFSRLNGMHADGQPRNFFLMRCGCIFVFFVLLFVIDLGHVCCLEFRKTSIHYTQWW